MNAYNILHFNSTFIELQDFQDRKYCQELMRYKESPEDERELKKEFQPYDQSIYQLGPLLNHEATTKLLKKYNLLKMRLSKLKERLEMNQDRRLICLGAEYIEECNRIKQIICFGNMRLSHKVLRKFHLDYLEHCGHAYETLCKAVDGFDPSFGLKFSTYAAASLYKNTIRYASESKKVKHYQYNEEYDIPDKREAEDRLETLDDLRIIKDTISKLRDKDRIILEHRYGMQGKVMSYHEVAKIMNCSSEAVRQIEKRALIKIRNILNVDLTVA